MTLNPLEEFVIARQLNDPADVSTYYVQAVIRNAKTDAVIATVNLDHKGSQRFTKTWQVVQDPTGLGLYITITTKVFTDSNYSVASTTYGIEQHEHLVQDRINPYLRGGGADVDYKRVRKIIQEELVKLPKAEIPKPEKVDLIPVVKGLHAVIDEVRGIRFPEQKETDLKPVISRMEKAVEMIGSIEIPRCDHAEIMGLIEHEVGEIASQVKKVKDALETGFGETQKKLDEFGGKLASATMVVIKDETAKEEPKKTGDEILKEYLNGR